MEERRKYTRIGVSFPLECTVLPSRNYFCTVSKDLSLGGVKIVSNDFLPKGDMFKLTINLIDRLVNCKAKVAWCNKERIGERYASGLEITEISPGHKEELNKFINTINNH